MDLSEFLKPVSNTVTIPFAFASDFITSTSAPITNYFSSFSSKPVASTTSIGTKSSWFPQKIGGLFFIVAILLAIIYVMSLFIRIPGISGPTLPRTGAPLWTGPETYTVASNINLAGNVSSSITPIDSSIYTVSMEIAINNPFANITSNKHIFHRGSPILDASGRDIAALNLQTVQQLDIPVLRTGIMNPAVFIPAGSTNTLKIFIQDANHQEITTVLIDGIPVYTPFRLTIVVSNHIMDTYINCKLVKSVFINSQVPSSTPTAVWGHIGTDLHGIIGGVRYFPAAFTSKQVELLCNISNILKQTN